MEKSTTLQTWNVMQGPGGQSVTLIYKTAYEKGEASEQFVYRLHGKVAKLVGYHVNSNALIIQ